MRIDVTHAECQRIRAIEALFEIRGTLEREDIDFLLKILSPEYFERTTQ